jgi:hypothetical protein
MLSTQQEEHMSKTYDDAYAAGLSAGLSIEQADAFARGKVRAADRASALDDALVDIVRSYAPMGQVVSRGYDREYEEEARLDRRDRARECNRDLPMFLRKQAD